MTRGRRGEKTYTGYNGASSDRMQELVKLAKTPAGQAGRLAAPSHEAVRTFIAAQLCPWCGEGPYKLLAQHTRHAHGVSAAELREAAGLIKDAQICSDDLSRAARERGRARGMPEVMAVAREGRRPGAKRSYSEAGKQVQRAKLDAARSPEQSRRAGAASAAQILAANADKHREIMRLFAAGMLMNDIAARVGVSQPTVRRTIRREGISADGRSLRWRAAPAIIGSKDRAEVPSTD